MNWTAYVERTIRQFSNYHRYEFINLAIILGVGLITGGGIVAYIMW